MKYSIGQKKRSRLQGHRKRRRTLEVSRSAMDNKLGLIEYKALRQYQSMGDMLDEFKIYGYRAGIENMLHESPCRTSKNGHNWLTVEPDSVDN